MLLCYERHYEHHCEQYLHLLQNQNSFQLRSRVCLDGHGWSRGWSYVDPFLLVPHENPQVLDQIFQIETQYS